MQFILPLRGTNYANKNPETLSKLDYTESNPGRSASRNSHFAFPISGGTAIPPLVAAAASRQPLKITCLRVYVPRLARSRRWRRRRQRRPDDAGRTSLKQWRLEIPVNN